MDTTILVAGWTAEQGQSDHGIPSDLARESPSCVNAQDGTEPSLSLVESIFTGFNLHVGQPFIHKIR